MDITYVCIIIRGTIKLLKLKLSRADGPRTEQKQQETERKLT